MNCTVFMQFLLSLSMLNVCHQQAAFVIVHHQVSTWINIKIKYGFKVENYSIIPIIRDKSLAAPELQLNIWCSCKTSKNPTAMPKGAYSVAFTANVKPNVRMQHLVFHWLKSQVLQVLIKHFNIQRLRTQNIYWPEV